MNKSRGQTGHLPIPKRQSRRRGVLFSSLDLIEQDTGGTMISEIVLRQCFPERQNTHLDRAQPQLKSWGGQSFGSQYRGGGALAPRARVWEGSPADPLPLWGSAGITPGKFFKTQMLNPAFWWLLCLLLLNFLLF